MEGGGQIKNLFKNQTNTLVEQLVSKVKMSFFAGGPSCSTTDLPVDSQKSEPLRGEK